MKFRCLGALPIVFSVFIGSAYADDTEWKMELTAFAAGKASGKLPATKEDITRCSAWFEMLDDLSNDALGYHFPEEFKYVTHEDTLEYWRKKSVALDGDSDKSYDEGEALFLKRTDASTREFFHMLGRCTVPIK